MSVPWALPWQYVRAPVRTSSVSNTQECVPAPWGPGTPGQPLALQLQMGLGSSSAERFHRASAMPLARAEAQAPTLSSCRTLTCHLWTPSSTGLRYKGATGRQAKAELWRWRRVAPVSLQLLLTWALLVACPAFTPCCAHCLAGWPEVQEKPGLPLVQGAQNKPISRPSDGMGNLAFTRSAQGLPQGRTRGLL